MVQIPNAAEAAPEVTTPATEVVETKKQKKARVAAEKAAASPVDAANPPAEGEAVPAVKKIGEHTYGKGLPNSGTTRTYDLPWSAKKITVLGALKALGATDSLTAKSAKEVITAADLAGTVLTGRDVRHYCYHAAAGGLAGVAITLPEGAVGGGYGFYLTALGVTQDFDAIAASLVKPVKAAAAATTVPVAPATEAAQAS